MNLRLRRRKPAGASRLPATLHPVLRRVYAARGVRDAAELDLALGRLHRPEGLPDLEQAAALLADVVASGGRILVVGDYDADGATGTALAVRALTAMGARQVDFLVPSRFAHGYGLSPALVDAARAQAPELLLTVDNGVAAVDGVAAARAASMRVIVTDHHLPGERLPPAHALVNPCLPGSVFPSRTLCGAGVVFYLMAALRRVLHRRGWFGNHRPPPRLARLLDLVALGTVADVVPLDHNNRILVRHGLDCIRQGAGVPGIPALLEAAGRQPQRATESDLGFAAAPRINAAGRLQDMALGIRCLLADEAEEAQELAGRLDALNRERRAIENTMREAAERRVAALALDDESLPEVLCLHEPDWHEGVIGILAGRLRERFHRPVVALAHGADGLLKGSARSVPGLHIRDALAAVDAHHPGLLARFGGHAMAAGLSLAPDRLAAFSAALGAEVRRMLGGAPPAPEVLTDGPLEPCEFTLETARALEESGPWGQGFPPPLFDARFEVLETRTVGEGQHLRLLLRPEGAGRNVPAILFRAAERGWPGETDSIHLAFRPMVNRFRDTIALQLHVEHVFPAGTEPEE